MPIKVVYIDDEEMLCQMFKEYLQSDKIDLAVFTDEDPGIAYCNKSHPDLIFIDSVSYTHLTLPTNREV